LVRHPAFKKMCEDVDPRTVMLDLPLPALDQDVATDDTSADDSETDPAPARTEVPAEPPAARPAPHRTTSQSKGPRASGISISSPEKVMYPDDGITKLDVARYYEAAGEWMIRFARERPLTLVRCPGGIRDCFYQKHVEGATHASVRKIPIAEEEAEGDYAMVETSQGIVALAQLGVLEFHTWGSRWSELETPDRFTIDLDPDPDLPWIRVIEAALDVRGWIEELRLSAFVKTTGGKGLHVVVPITPSGGWDEVKEFSRCVAASVEADWPGRYTLHMSKDRRRGRILLDYLRNGRGATAVEAYSTRSRPGAPVSTPITWEELTSGVQPGEFTLRTVPDRLSALKADPWDDYDRAKRPITRAMKTALGVA
jgi:bifunctional non-homologous end joining protein LigD